MTTPTNTTGNSLFSDTVNKVELIGRLGRDPEYKVLEGGVKVCNLNLCTDVPKGKDAERKLTPHWAKVVAWGDRAEAMNNHLKKGSLVHVYGVLEERSYESDWALKQINQVLADLAAWWNPAGLMDGLVAIINKFTWTKKVTVHEVRVTEWYNRTPAPKEKSDNAHAPAAGAPAGVQVPQPPATTTAAAPPPPAAGAAGASAPYTEGV